MTRIVSFLHSEYDLDDMKRCDLEEIAVSSTEGITHALERVHKTKKGIVGKFSLELGEMHDSLVDTVPEDILPDIALAIGVQYLPRLTHVLPSIIDLFTGHGAPGTTVQSTMSTVYPLVHTASTTFLALETSRTIRAYIRAPLVALRWAVFFAHACIFELTYVRHQVRVLEFSADLLSHILILGKPLHRSQGGDARSCLPLALRKDLELALDKYVHPGAMFPDAALRAMKVLRKELEMIAKFRSYVRGKYLADKARFMWCACCGGVAAGVCGRCEHTWYCSRDCQREDWAAHKRRCFDHDYSALQ